MNNKKSLVALALVALVGIVGGTFAYFTSSTTLNNEFTTGTYSTSVTEEFVSPDNWTPGTTTTKKVNVTNNGNVEVAVRASYTEKWTAKNGTVLSGTRNGEQVAQFTIGSDWEAATDGYYYYKETLKGGQTSSDFISSVTFNLNFELEEGTDIECTTTKENGKVTSSCTSLTSGYAGATYSLNIIIETIQVDQKWGYELKTDETTLPDQTIEVASADELAEALDYISKLEGNGNETYTINIREDIDLIDREWEQSYDINRNLLIEGNLQAVKNATFYNGLIASIGTGKTLTVKNLDFDCVEVIGVSRNGVVTAGTVVGSAYGTVVLENVNVSDGRIMANDSGYIGGLVGYSKAPITITNATVSNCSLSSADKIGGIVGYTDSTVELNDSAIDSNFVESDDEGEIYVGLVVGQLDSSAKLLMYNSIVMDNNANGTPFDLYTSSKSTGTVTVN